MPGKIGFVLLKQLSDARQQIPEIGFVLAKQVHFTLDSRLRGNDN